MSQGEINILNNWGDWAPFTLDGLRDNDIFVTLPDWTPYIATMDNPDDAVTAWELTIGAKKVVELHKALHGLNLEAHFRDVIRRSFTKNGPVFFEDPDKE